MKDKVVYVSPDGNRSVWDGNADKPHGYYTASEWDAMNPEGRERSYSPGQTPSEMRHGAYVLEADPLRDEALSYQLEADAYRLDGNLTAAVMAEERMNAALRLYREKKEEIRARFPDAKYLLGPTGTYHDTACSYSGQSSDLLTLAEIAGRNPGAKPCSRCNPPTL